MGTAKVVSIKSRPFQVAHLCFDSDGILDTLNTQLGATAAGFNYPTFYATMASRPTVPGIPSRLLYDFLAIQAATAPSALASLRAEPRKAALDKAINARQNAFFAKYGNIQNIVSRMNALYSPTVLNSKANRIDILASISQQLTDALRAAYVSDGRLGVVKTTSSVLNSTTESSSSTSQQGSASATGVTDEIGEATQIPTRLMPNLPPAGTTLGQAGEGFTGPNPMGMSLLESNNATSTATTDASQTTGSATERQTIVSTDYGYRVPFLESQAQNQRAQISLLDEQFAQFLFAQPLPNLTTVFENELLSIDGDVYRLQISFLNSILLSPFAGTVTGVYKNPGDPVRAGDPVVRVENNDTALLVATVVYRDRVAIGSNVTVQTKLFDSSASTTTISGRVVSARGHASEDDKWDIVVQCNNVNGGAQVLPIDYHFDYDDTVVTIT
jgi:hypothetical protein